MKAVVSTSQGEHHFTLFENSKKMIEDIIQGKTYPILPLARPPRTIVDIGAYIGASVLYFHSHYPEARIWAFEPSRQAYNILNENIAGIDQTRVFNFGLYDQDTSMKLYKGNFDGATNSIGQSMWNSEVFDVISVKNADTFFLTNNITQIDILKIDTEGCEVPILRSIRELLPQISVVYLEFHSHDDRMMIDNMLSPSHLLQIGNVYNPHRGELCYVARHAFPSGAAVDRDKITLQ